MSGTPLVIVGAGGHGRELLDIVAAIDAAAPTFAFLGFHDDVEPETTVVGVPARPVPR